MTKRDAAASLGPIELEVIAGAIRSAELKIEAAVERTARSPMIRDQHDYRVALFAVFSYENKSQGASTPFSLTHNS